MDINNLFGIHELALQMRTKRAELLASNLANADTPGYRAKDLDFQETFESFKNQDNFNLNSSNKNHINDISKMLEAQVFETPSLNASMDKNSVDTHIEKGKMAQNGIQYMASLRFIEARIKGLMTAIKGE